MQTNLSNQIKVISNPDILLYVKTPKATEEQYIFKATYIGRLTV